MDEKSFNVGYSAIWREIERLNIFGYKTSCFRAFVPSCLTKQ
jgi:hypothetical protein